MEDILYEDFYDEKQIIADSKLSLNKFLAKKAIEAVIGGDNISYVKEKVNDWWRQIIDGCLKELAKSEKMFKYI